MDRQDACSHALGSGSETRGVDEEGRDEEEETEQEVEMQIMDRQDACSHASQREHAHGSSSEN